MAFFGPNAGTCDNASLEAAHRRLERGDDAECVRQDTGWFRGMDGKFRFEVSDHDAVLVDAWYVDRVLSDGANEVPVYALRGNLAPVSYKLNEIVAAQLGQSERTVPGVLHHSALFAGYPQLAQVAVRILRSSALAPGATGHFKVGRNGLGEIHLEVGPDPDGDVVMKALLHEIQHAIQWIEGFARGGATSEFQFDGQLAIKAGDARQDIELFRGMRNTPEKPLQDILEEIEALGWDLQRYCLEHLQFLQEMAGTTPEYEHYLQSAAIERLPVFYRYRNLAGEVEARNVETRLRMTPDQRHHTPPSATADVHERDVILAESLSRPARRRAPGMGM